MKQISSVMILNIDGGDRVSFTYNEVDDATGKLISVNNKQNFVAVNAGLQKNIKAVRDYIQKNILEEDAL